MQLTPLPPITLRDLAAVNEASVTRTPGCHVTDIVREIMIGIDPKRYARTYDAGASENWQEAGFIWEELLSRLFAQRIEETATRFRPGEVTRDDIIGSPDAVCIEDNGETLIVEEYKATWKSSRGFDLYDKRYLYWLLQIQAYCYMIGARQARLYVLHINGNYEGYIPQTSGWLLTFTEIELAEAWQGLRNMGRKKGWIT